MAVRIRNSAQPNSGGGRYLIGTTPFQTPGTKGATKHCEDVIGNPTGENPFYLTSFYVTSSPSLNGKVGVTTLENVTPSCVASPAYSHLSLTGFRSVADGIRSSHPGEPSVDIPNFLYELKDLPSMLKHAGDRAKSLWDTVSRNKPKGATARDVSDYMRNPKNPAQDFLHWNFGWRPFFSDLADLAGITKAMDARRRMMKSLLSQNKSYITRRANLGSQSGQSVTSGSYNSVGAGILGKHYKSTVHTKWCVSHFTYNPLVFQSAMSSNWRLLAMSTGFDVSLTHFWDVMPWSWLIDWFTDASSVIHSYNNRWGIGFKNASTMEHLVTTQTTVPEPNPYGGTPASWTYETKSRTPSAPSLTLPDGLNYFNSGQLTTLAALATTRLAR